MTGRGARHGRRQVLVPALLLCVASLSACSRGPAQRPDTEVVVATVDNAVVTLHALKSEIASIRESGSAPSGATRAEIEEALERLVDRTLVITEGRARGVDVGEAEVEAEVRRFGSDFPPGGLEKYLTQKGITAAQWRDELHASLLFRKSARAVAASLPLPETPKAAASAGRKIAAVEPAPSAVHIRQFLFDTKEEAERGRKRLMDGEGADSVVGPDTGGRGVPSVVDLGELLPSDIPEALRPELVALRPGEVSRVSVGDRLFSVFQVVPKSASPKTASAQEADPAREDAFRAWLDARRRNASVNVQEALLVRMSEDPR